MLGGRDIRRLHFPGWQAWEHFCLGSYQSASLYIRIHSMHPGGRKLVMHPTTGFCFFAVAGVSNLTLSNPNDTPSAKPVQTSLVGVFGGFSTLVLLGFAGYGIIRLHISFPLLLSPAGQHSDTAKCRNKLPRLFAPK